MRTISASATTYEMSPAELAEWDRRTSHKRPHAAIFEDECWSDHLWRICNIYMCLSPEGKAVHFVPSPEQRTVIWCIWVLGWQRVVIPKARQLGMSLVLCLMALDQQVFTDGFHCALIDKLPEDAAKKMDEKVKFAFLNLPSEITDGLHVTVDNSKEFTFESLIKPDGVTVTSSFQCGVTFRGGTVKWLHISEWGTIQNDTRTREKSVEIKTGAVPAVERADDGVLVIETTWKGGLDGEIGPYVVEALNTPDDQKGPKSWRILFFGWHTEPSYRQPHGHIDAESAKYFRECEARGLFLTHEQKLWYAEKRRTATNAKTVKEEYPTFVEECWEALVEGSIYGKYIEESRLAGRIIHFMVPKDYPVHTFWDVGHPLNTVTWLVQVTPQQIRMVDVLMEMDMTIQQRAAWLRERGWDYGNHYFPHDSDSDKDSMGLKPITIYRQVLGPTCQVVPVCKSVWDGIGLIRTNFPRIVWCCDATEKDDDISTPGARVKRGLDYLKRYRAVRENSTGITKLAPIHDRYSHGASALAQLGLVIGMGRVAHANSVGTREPVDRPPVRVITAGSTY